MPHKNNWNLYLSVILITVILFSLLTIYAASEAASKSSSIGTSAKAATLYEPETGNFLYSKNAEERLPMASTTKIMTALVALESSSLDEEVIIDTRAVGTEGSSAYLKENEVLTMEELLYALMLQSANDAAVAIACHISGSIEDFANLMNEKAKAIGLSDTHFENPHGLDSEEHYTTAHDLAVIAAEALKNPIFKTVCSTYKKSFSSKDKARLYVNHNKLLKSYDGSIGMKTGFTKKSGRCLVGAAERDGLTFITVTLDAPNDWSDHKALLDFGYDTLEKITFAESGELIYDIKVIGAAVDTLRVFNPTGASVIVDKGEHTTEKFVKLSRFVQAPIKKGDILGEVIFTVDTKAVASVYLVATETIQTKKQNGFFKKIIEKITG